MMEEKVGWIDTNLSVISNKITDGSHNPPPKSEVGEPMLSAQNVFDDHILFEGYRLITSDNFEKEYKRANVEPGDVLLTIVGTIGRSTVVPDKIRKFTLQRSVALIKPNTINSHYISYYLRSPKSQIYFQQNSKGTAQKGIYLNSLKKLPISFPPLLEQHAIVSKIEQLFSDLDNGIANLKLAQEQLKVYRQAVLKKAFEGELTREWREQQTNLTDAEDLLEQIRLEREENYNKKLDEWKGAIKEWESAGKEGKKPSKPKKIKKTERFTESELVDLPKLLENWAWIRLEEISNKITDGSHNPPPKSEVGEPMLSAQNVFDDHILFEGYRLITSDNFEKEYKRANVEPGDVLLTIVGTIGRSTVVPDKIRKFTLQRSVALIKPNTINSHYISYYLRSPKSQPYFQNHSKGTAQKGIYLNSLKNLPISLAPLPEQQAIVTEIETRLSVCEKVEQDIEENLERAEALRLSILKKAFEGKLLNKRELEEVRNEADWEPAEVLLERIKTEKANKK
ncbi:restriction endonuclease subunit S [Methanococcoides methylutens]|uniref:Type I restriction-modification system, specificity subunit S n=1 Tax=Methanococcoides methylutens MM1 TaxID=1434104 RepID=A0A0E3SSC6_METMT|nr:restriction endonuclease subunit S [Methanococcoides methylutens]AKB85408.1 Type I restriction-modification system, specificity subunit S [Methanococcoides methylutens MM1]